MFLGCWRCARFDAIFSSLLFKFCTFVSFAVTSRLIFADGGGMVGLFCRWCSPGWFQRGRFVIGTIRGFIFLVHGFSVYWQVEVPSYVMDVASFIVCSPFSSSCVIGEILAKNLNRRFNLLIIARFWVDFDGALIALMEPECTTV